MESSSKENGANWDDDRLSNLPDDILHYILSLSNFQIFDVVKLGVLSKRWNRLWLTMPYLSIDISLICHLLIEEWKTADSTSFYYPVIDDTGKPVDWKIVENYRNFITWVLTRQGQSRLVRFRLCSTALFDKVQILRWLRVVADRNVQELDINFVPSGEFNLPLFIAVNGSLQVLKLTLHDQIMKVPTVVGLNQLRSLELNRIWFSDGDFLQRLFSGCCSLESLTLSDCLTHDFSSFDFTSTHLKELIIEFTAHYLDYEFMVSCPNLILFKYVGPTTVDYILENVCSLQTVWVELFEDGEGKFHVGHMIRKKLKQVQHVKDLSLNVDVVDCLSYVIDELICCPPSFPNLKSLRLEVGTIYNNTQVMVLLLDHCPNLEVFTLVSEQFDVPVWDYKHCELQYEGLVSWKPHPHLRTIKFVEFNGKDYQLNFLRILLKSVENLEKLDIVRTRFSDSISLDVIRTVLMFPKASSGILVTFLNPQHNADDQ